MSQVGKINSCFDCYSKWKIYLLLLSEKNYFLAIIRGRKFFPPPIFLESVSVTASLLSSDAQDISNLISVPFCKDTAMQLKKQLIGT